MADCCSTVSKKHTCFHCGQLADPVSLKTLLHHLSYPFNQTLADDNYFYCSNSSCDTVYFSHDGVTSFTQQQLREHAWQKTGLGEDLICFCFGLSYEQLTSAETASGENSVEAFIADQTRQGLCECEARNVSGKCCLAVIKKARKSSVAQSFKDSESGDVSSCC